MTLVSLIIIFGVVFLLLTACSELDFNILISFLSFIILARKRLRCCEQCEFEQDIPRLSKLTIGDTIVDVQLNRKSY